MGARSRQDTDLPTLIGDLYQAAVQPELWNSALDRMSDILGGAAFVFGVHDDKAFVFGAMTRIDPAFWERLLADYRSAESNPFVAAAPRLPLLQAIPRQQILTDDSYYRSSLFNEIHRPQGLVHIRATCLGRSAGRLISASLMRRAGREFTGEHAKLFEILMPHLGRAIAMTKRTLELVAERDLATAAADAMADALMVVDASGRLLWCNGHGERILESGDGLALRRGRIVAASGAERERFARLIASAANREGLHGGSLRLPRRSGASPWALIVMPVPDGVPGAAGQGTALLRIVDLERRPVAPQERLTGIFGLSQAEARLATDLLAGEQLEAMAARRRLKISTIRTQLRSTFSKTGTSRQAELVRLLAQVADPTEHDANPT